MDNQQNMRPSRQIGIGSIMMRIALVSFCLVLLSVHLMSGLFAKYTTTGSGSDEARVAKFSVSGDDTLLNQLWEIADMKPGDKHAKTVEIHNTGEVTVVCKMKIENLTDNLPIADTETTLITIAPGEVETVNATIIWPEDRKSVEYVGKMDVLRITIIVEQVD